MPAYEDSVFLNVPFDAKYKRIFNSLVFAVHDCGFSARSALEVEDSGQARVEKILNIIEQGKVRNWLSSHRSGIQMPGGKAIFERYSGFRAQLPAQANDVRLDHKELTFRDYTNLVVGWLKKNPW